MSVARCGKGVREQEFDGFGVHPISKWHRTIAPHCYATDLDHVEYRVRNGRLKAVLIVEYKARSCKDPDRYLTASTRVLLNTAADLKIPFLICWYELDFFGNPSSVYVYRASEKGLEGDIYGAAIKGTMDDWRRFLERH